MTPARRERYFGLQHLASAVWFNHDPARCYMAIFTQYTAYFDASGHPDDTKVMYVSGFVASEAKWLKFESAWLALLDEFRIEPPFHATEFESRQGDYGTWPDAQRNKFRLRAIRSFTPPRLNKAISFGVVIADLRRMFEEYECPPELPREPYAWCGQQVVSMVLAWALHRSKNKTLGPHDKLEFVFEHGDKHRGQLEKSLARSDLLPIFRKKKDVIAFQACDFLAWQHRNWLTKRDPLRRRASHAVQEITRVLARDSLAFHSWESLAEECERQGFPKRLQTVTDE